MPLVPAVSAPHFGSEFAAGHDERRRLPVALECRHSHDERLFQVALTRCRHSEGDAGFRVAHRRALASVKVRTCPEDLLSERARELVLTDHPVVVHRVEIELTGSTTKWLSKFSGWGLMRVGRHLIWIAERWAGRMSQCPAVSEARSGRASPGVVGRPGWRSSRFLYVHLRCGSSGLVSVGHSRCSGGIRRGRLDCRSSWPVR